MNKSDTDLKCKRCNQVMLIRDGEEPTKVCGHCAHEMISEISDVIGRYGQIDGEHHKTWVIDQVARICAANEYEEWVREHNSGVDGPETYKWNTGIEP
jgi:acetyl-CoA carboxylase beta subunit